MRYLYLGQSSMGNRGCEALVRSNTALIRERVPDATFLCPSENIALDRVQWPEAESLGVEFIDVFPFSRRLVWWSRAGRITRAAEKIDPPAYPVGGAFKAALDRCDAVLMTGGDIISLDYGLFSLYHWASLVEAAACVGKPVHLLGASVGPFAKLPHVEARMRRHLGVYDSISVRETPSLAYVRSLGTQARLVADPAFTMQPQPWDDATYLPAGTDILGLNFSPLVRNTRGSEESKQAFDADIVRFMASVVADTAMDVLLVPHVYPLGMGSTNSDRAYMQGLMQRLSPEAQARVRLLPPEMNAAQLKYALGKCRYFMGARTHATVGSLSQSVPTCSIAYSIKALGINQDLLGDTRYVLPTPEVTFDTLWAHLRKLQDEESAARALLDERIPEWKTRARAAIDLLM